MRLSRGDIAFLIFSGFGLGMLVCSAIYQGVFIPDAEAGKIVGETSTYAREQGFRTRLFYVSAGDGAGQVEFICKTFPGLFAGNSTANAVWQVRRFTYDSSDRVSTILFAGEDDAYNQVCDNRASLSYS